MKKFNASSDTIKAAYIAGIFTLVAAIIGGFFLIKATNTPQSSSTAVSSVTATVTNSANATSTLTLTPTATPSPTPLLSTTPSPEGTVTFNENTRLSCNCSDPVVVTVTKIAVEPVNNRMIWSLTFHNTTQIQSFAHFDRFSLQIEDQDQIGGQIYDSTGGMLVRGNYVEDVILQANQTQPVTLMFSFIPYKDTTYNHGGWLC